MVPSPKGKGKLSENPAPLETESGTAKEGSKQDESPAVKIPSVDASKTSNVKSRKTEIPTQQAHDPKVYETSRTDEAAIGNPKMIYALKREGMLGVFYDRVNTVRTPTLIPLLHSNYYESIESTMYNILYRALLKKMYLNLTEVDDTASRVAKVLTTGIMIATYLKLRNVNYFDSRCTDRFQQVPKVPAPLEVPRPYALAISQLGRFKSSGAVEEGYYSPTISVDAPTFLIMQGSFWSSSIYTQAMEFAKNLGLKFSTPDLGVKMGSSWWLYKPVQEQNHFRLSCLIPEENFTVTTAVLRTLFCSNGTGGVLSELFDLASLGAVDYGSMLRNPPAGVDQSTYNAIDEEPSEMFRFD
ncbi:TPA_asm: coat protein [Arceuthobium sichuanense virus 5]|nr:TPA_asm: coat protein [Arceuthobium sichuanense virus 5]